MVMIVPSLEIDSFQKKNRVKKLNPKSHRIGFIKFEKPERITVILCSILAALVIAFVLILFDSGLGNYKGAVLNRDSGDISSHKINGHITGDITSQDNTILSDIPPEIFDNKRFESPLNSTSYEKDSLQNIMLSLPSGVGETWFLNTGLSKFITAEAHLAPTEKLFNIDQ